MHEKKTSRHLAVLCLASWDRERQAVQPYIESMIYSSSLSSTDRQFAGMMVQGVLRQLQYLDHILSRYAKHPLKKMKPLTLMTLRVGVYQLLFLDRVPASAAVDETVKVLKAEHQPRWIVSFVNGVLRSISRAKEDLPRPEDATEKGSAVLNHPQWLVRRWQKRYGPQKTEMMCRTNNREPFLALRVNTLQTDPARLIGLFSEVGIDVHGGRYAPGALIVATPAGPVTSLPGYDEGLFHVQDEAAQLVTLLLGPFEKGGRYLDACAGLGGKTCQLAQLVTTDSHLVALEPNPHRFQRLRENLQRLGLDGRVKCLSGRIDELEEPAQLFQAVLVDAPCSGTGVIRRHPEIRWNRRPEDLLAYQQQQLAILENAGRLLAPGGVLVYATCSMEPEENEELIGIFLSRNNEFSLGNAGDCLPASGRELVSKDGYFSSTPAEGLDGFFGARLEKGVK